MAIKLNGSDVTVNKLDGANITLESLNGEQVYPTGLTVNTADPSFVGAACRIIVDQKYIVFQVRNNDDVTAEIKYGSSSSVLNSAGNVNPSATTSLLSLGPYIGSGSATIYARAIASGKQPSMVISQTVSYTLCFTWE
jgi:hypothetical protein